MVWRVTQWQHCVDSCKLVHTHIHHLLCMFCFYFWHLVTSQKSALWDRAHARCMPFGVRTSLVWAGGTRAYGVLFPIVFGSGLAAELCESRDRSWGIACWCSYSANTWGRSAFNARPVACCGGCASLLGNTAFFLLTCLVFKKGMLGHILCI